MLVVDIVPYLISYSSYRVDSIIQILGARYTHVCVVQGRHGLRNANEADTCRGGQLRIDPSLISPLREYRFTSRKLDVMSYVSSMRCIAIS